MPNLWLYIEINKRGGIAECVGYFRSLSAGVGALALLLVRLVMGFALICMSLWTLCCSPEEELKSKR
jgi:hypothetical protein